MLNEQVGDDRSAVVRGGDGPTVRRYPWKGHRFGRLILTVCNQAANAPFNDHAWTTDQDGNVYSSRAILLAPWRKNTYGERPPMRAFVIGWGTRKGDDDEQNERQAGALVAGRKPS